MISDGSRISHWGVPTHWGGANLRRIHFSVKTYVKTKEIDPVGGARAGDAPLDPPMMMVLFRHRKVTMKKSRTEYFIFTVRRININQILVLKTQKM